MLGIEMPDKQKPKPMAGFGFLMEEEDAYSAWDAYVDSERIVLATAGGWLDQPYEWHQVVATLDALFSEEYEKLDAWLESKKPADKRRERPKLPPNFK